MLKSFRLKATIEVLDENNYGESATVKDALSALSCDLQELAFDTDRQITITNIEPIEDEDFIS